MLQFAKTGLLFVFALGLVAIVSTVLQDWAVTRYADHMVMREAKIANGVPQVLLNVPDSADY